MPTINSYADKQGYYIRARPSGVGNITYKIKDAGNPVIWKHGLRDGDDVAWSTIQSFKALGIIYTEESGTLGPDDFEPDPEQLEKTELTEADARELFSIISTQFNLSRTERKEIRTILGLPLEIDFEIIGERIKSHIKSYMSEEGFPVRPDRTVYQTDEIDISTWVDEDDSAEYDTWQLHILVVSEANNKSLFTDHCIHLCDEHGLERWHLQVLDTPTWEIKRTGITQKSIIFPILLDELQSAGFNLGDPTEVMSPQVGFSELNGTE